MLPCENPCRPLTRVFSDFTQDDFVAILTGASSDVVLTPSLGFLLVCSAKSCEVFQENSHHFRSSQVNLLTGSDLKANDKNFNGRTISTKTAAIQHHHEPVFFFRFCCSFLKKKTSENLTNH